MRRACLAACMILAGCEPTTGPSIGPGPVPVGGDAGLCAGAEQGCPCEGSQEPIDCYLPATTTPDGRIECNAGTRYCRDGSWTGCESLRTYTLRPTTTALIDGPSTCNPCDPSCFVSRDVPTPADLTPGNSTGVEYQPSPAGITLPAADPATVMLPDGDGDGVPDAYDNFPADPTRDGFTENGGLFHVLPYGTAAPPDPLIINTAIQTADVYFLIDRTGSMGGEISNLRAGLTSGTYRTGCAGGVIGAIQCVIPDAWVGVGWFGEFPVYPYGDSDDIAYRNVQDLTASIAAAQTAVNGITTNGNIDWVEASGPALYASVTGSALGQWVPARTSCPAGTWGYPCFRDGTIPIVVVITDAPIHNGPNPAYDYDPDDFFILPSAVAIANTNETFTNAYNAGNVTGTSVRYRGSTMSMTNDIGFGCNAGARDAVVRFTLTSAQRTVITLEGSDFDTVLGVFNAATLTGWCNDDAVGLQSRLVLDLPAGDYYAVVDGYNGARGTYRLGIGTPWQPPTWAQTVAALRARNVKTVFIDSSAGYLDCRQNGVDLGAATGSVDSGGNPFVFSISDTGSGLSSTVVDAIEALANYSRMDVTARARDNPATAAVDETAFVDSIVASSFPAGRCAGISADGRTFLQCLPGTAVQFTVTFRNDVVMPTSVPQIFDFTMELVGDGTAILSTVPVRIVVPPQLPTYPPSGSYWRDHDSTTRCLANERPDWGNLSWTATAPAGTSIRFELRTATTIAALDTASAVSFTYPGTASPVDVGQRLVSGGQLNYLPYLRVTAVLNSNAARTSAPTLSSMSLDFVCAPIE
ncbi:MAG: hypothetical protein IT378_06055 [Sandaracinaceae bacterium]|nr:hypothetical protein [Sandaracinaceae bacterium]